MSENWTPEEFDEFLRTLTRLLRLGTRQRQAIVEELQSHLEARYEDLVNEGVEPREAASRALAEFGDAAALAAELSTWSRLKRRRRLMRWTTGTLVGTLMLALAVVGLWQDRPSPWGGSPVMAQQESAKSPAPQADDPDEALWRSLEKRLDIEMQDLAIDDALAYLSDVAGIQYYYERRAIENAGVDLETCKVSLNLKNIPAEMALRLILEQAELVYSIENGVVIVTTPEGLRERALVVRVYRVDDLVEARRRDPPAMSSGEEPAGGAGAGLSGPVAQGGMSGGLGGYGPGGGFGGGMGGSGMLGTALQSGPPYDIEALMNVVVNTVAPESWDVMDGEGRICEFRGALVIAQSVRNHRQIRQLLEELRKATQEATAGNDEDPFASGKE